MYSDGTEVKNLLSFSNCDVLVGISDTLALAFNSSLVAYPLKSILPLPPPPFN